MTASTWHYIVVQVFMSLLRQVAHNTAFQVIGKTVGTAFGFIATVIVLRYLGDEKYGNFTTAMTYLQLFGIVMDLGLYVVLLKYIGTEKNVEGRLFQNIFTLRLVTAMVFLLIACSSVWFIASYPTIVKWAVLVVATNFLFITVNQLFLGVYQHQLATARVAIAEISSKVVLLLITLVVVYILHGGLLLVMFALVMSGFVQTFILASGLQRFTHLRLAFDLSIWRDVFKESWPIAVAIALNLIYFKSDTLILALYYPQAVVGIYGAPYKILEVLITIPAMIVGLLMPVLGKNYTSGTMEKFHTLYRRAMHLLALLALPMVVGAMILAQPIMLLIAGREFTSKPEVLGQLLSILIIAVGMIFIGTFTGYVVVIINRQRSILFGYGFIALTALIGYLLFIPAYSYYGAAWVTVYAETSMMLIASVLIYRVTGARPDVSGLLKIIFASVVMGLLLMWLRDVALWFLIPLASLVYGATLIAIRGITIAELKTVLNLRA